MSRLSPAGRPRRGARRVLLTTDTAGGVWTHSMELAQALAAEGVEVIVATLGPEPSSDQRADAGARGLALRSHSCRLPWMEEPWEDVEAAGGWLVALARELGPDVVHLSEPVFGALDWRAPAVVVGHSCVLSWWEAVLGEPAPAAWDRYRAAMRLGFGAAAGVVAPSRAMLAALGRHYGVTTGAVIPNGRSSTGLEPGRKSEMVLTATRLWDEAKNVAALDWAAERLPWPVYAAGDPRPPGGGEQVCCRQLELLGRLPAAELAGWMARASIFALPARYEPFGLSALEAALAGCALVLGDVPSLREQWEGVAVFVPPDDAATLRSAIAALIRDAGLRQTLAMRARRRALRLTPRRMALRYLEVYSSLLEGVPGPRAREATSCAS